MTEDEKLYTLAEARKIVKRERCEMEPHELELKLLQRRADGRVTLQGWVCANCDIDVQLTYPD